MIVITIIFKKKKKIKSLRPHISSSLIEILGSAHGDISQTVKDGSCT